MIKIACRALFISLIATVALIAPFAIGVVFAHYAHPILNEPAAMGVGSILAMFLYLFEAFIYVLAPVTWHI